MDKNRVCDIAVTIVGSVACIFGLTYDDVLFVVSAGFLLVGFPATWIENKLKKRDN